MKLPRIFSLVSIMVLSVVLSTCSVAAYAAPNTDKAAVEAVNQAPTVATAFAVDADAVMPARTIRSYPQTSDTLPADPIGVQVPTEPRTGEGIGRVKATHGPPLLL